MQAGDPVRGCGQRLVEALIQAVAGARRRHHADLTELADLAAQLVRWTEGIGLALDDQNWTPDPRPVLCAELLRETWPVERVGEEEQAGEVVLGIGCGHARHPAAIGAAADHHAWAGAGLLQEYRDGPFGVAARQLDSLGIDTPRGKPIDVRLQRLHAARGTRTQEHLHSDCSIASSVAYSAGLMMSQVLWTVPGRLGGRRVAINLR